MRCFCWRSRWPPASGRSPGSPDGAESNAPTPQLDGVLRSALQEYTGELAGADRRATSVAARRDVQLALLHGNRARLARIAKSLPSVTLVPRRGAAFGATHGPAARRSVDVIVGKQRVGRVIAAVPFNGALLRRLTLAAGVPAGDRLVFRTDLPATVTLGETRYHASGARLQGRVALVALAPSAGVEGAGNRLRNRVLLAGLITLGCLFLLVWFFAPVIAQGRLGRRQRDQADRVLRHLGEGVLLVDGAGIVRLWNPSAEAITGLDAADLQGRPADEVIPGWAELRERIPVGDRASAATVPFGGLWLSISGTRFSDGAVYAFRDLTEERRLEQMRSDFVATVSHELRTPLASIHGAAVTMSSRGPQLGPALHERLLAIVVEQSERLSELVEQILLAAQLDSGGLRIERERFDAAVLARKVIASSRPRIPTGLTVSLATSDEIPPALGDAERARFVLGNLLDNAIKYSPDGGRIDVTVARENGHLQVHRPGSGPRHPGGRAGADLREVLPPRRGDESRRRRQRPRAVHLP